MKSPRQVSKDQASLALFVLAALVLISPLRFVWLRAEAPWWTAFIIGLALIGAHAAIVFRGAGPDG